MRRTSFFDIPQELVDLIIDHFHNDFTTLHICAVVSRAWLYPARAHLFREVLLARPEDVYNLQQLIIAKKHIARCVRTLKINSKIFKPGPNPDKPVQSGYIEYIQQSLFKPLIHLRTLHFDYVHFDTVILDQHLLEAIGELPICELKFTRCDFRDFETFEKVVFANTNVTHLSLDDVKWKETPDFTVFSDTYKINRASLALTHISFGGYCEIELYRNWLEQGLSFSSLRSLEATGLAQIGDVQLVAGILEKVASTLQHLRLRCLFSCAHEYQLSEIPSIIDLAPLQHLYSLHLSPQGLDNRLFSWAPNLLSQITSPNLRKITIDAHLHASQRELKLKGWEQFVALIKAPRFSGVEQVCVWHRGPMEWKGAEELVKGCFGGLREYQKVRVEDHIFRG
ncbi:hypothetical protein BDY19DRAFT_392007 [Irpex rosettiformis]|uniref:Uncharacterized protein n=1 Tax=Irpex rosettiformis TaxID=378272 RepID=A0ACB8TV22_9APHY|nr:hypothetical protein BDY19DRAFT_392007 [Irpex rosettiformis]